MYDGDECDKGRMLTKIELTLEQSQQGVSNDVLVSIEGVEELKRNVWIKGLKKEALYYTLGRNRVNTYAIGFHYGESCVIQKNNAIVIHDSEETLMLADESCSKMLQKQNESIMSEKKTELSAEQAFWSRYSLQHEEPNLSSSTTIVEGPKELPQVSMRTPSKAKKNKLKDHHRTVEPSLNKKKSVVNTKSISSVTNSKLNVNADLKCATCNECLFFDNHDSCVLAYINSVNASLKSKSVPKP
nr:hypothetical protein [Tanacetum cinerariifolium]